MSDLISGIKFNSQFQNLPLLCHPLVEELSCHYRSNPLPKKILPVPLYPSRLKQRGFNQALIIAREVKKQLVSRSPKFKTISIDSSSVEKNKNTLPQIGLDAKSRLNNLKGAFIIKRQLPDHVALVDDVMTTGATVTSIASQLKSHGVDHIDIWCIARATIK